jgi:hypothetical protein
VTIIRSLKNMRRKDQSPKKSLTPRQVAAIYTDRTRSQYQLSELYRVSQSMISLIRSDRRWARLTRNLPRYRRMDYRHTRSGRRKLTAPQVRDIFASLLDKQILIDAYQVDRRTVERIREGVLHKSATHYLTRSA